ncbi:hypothetical protein XalbCFBP2523_07625 [Xanthomonas albilineans]|nr:hypothetical protein XalbCFBP2523_07625 [Xanthomonas albilineans]
MEAGLVLSEDPKRWLIPHFAHQLPRLALTGHTPCFAIEYGGDPYGIVLPMIEAIRFYYAVSTDLAHAVFSGAFQLHLHTLIDTDVSGPLRDSNRMVVRLRQWLADDDGWVIGRILGDGHARAGVTRIYDSLLKSTANRAAVFPGCGLPFRGVTDWSTRGVDLPVDGGGKRWLIHELLRCSAPFPFDELEVVRDNDGTQADPGTDLPEDEKRPAWSPPRRTAKLGADAEIQSDDQPEAQIDSIDISLASERFEALNGKSVIKTPKTECRYKRSSFRRTQVVVLLGAGAAGGQATGVGPLRVTLRREAERLKSLPASFDALLKVVDALNTLESVSASVRPPTPATVNLPLTKPRGRWQWGYLDSAGKIERRVMVIDIECAGCCGSLVEFERRRSERSKAALLILFEAVPLSDERLKRLLHALVNAEGVWANLKPHPADMKLALFNHSRTSAEAFADDICTALQRASNSI